MSKKGDVKMENYDIIIEKLTSGFVVKKGENSLAMKNKKEVMNWIDGELF